MAKKDKPTFDEKTYFVGPDTALEVSENVRYVWRLAADRESLLRVAMATLEYYQIKAVSAGGEAEHWQHYAPQMIVDALKEVEYLL